MTDGVAVFVVFCSVLSARMALLLATTSWEMWMRHLYPWRNYLCTFRWIGINQWNWFNFVVALRHQTILPAVNQREMQFTHQKRTYEKAFISSFNTCLCIWTNFHELHWIALWALATHTHTHFFESSNLSTSLKCFKWCRYDIIDWFKHFKSIQNAISPL